jgi:hypothetical protein
MKLNEYVKNQDELQNIVNYIHNKTSIKRKDICEILRVGCNFKLNGDFCKIIKCVYDDTREFIYKPEEINISFHGILDLSHYISNFFKISDEEALELFEYGYNKIIKDKNEEILNAIKIAKDSQKRLKLNDYTSLDDPLV